MATHAFWVNGASPWAADASESALYLSKSLLVATLLVLLLSGVFRMVLLLMRLLLACLLDSVTGVSVGGAGLFSHQSEHCLLE